MSKRPAFYRRLRFRLRSRKELLRVISRRFWGVVFTLIIAAAVIVQLGREAFPLLNEYRDEISRQLGRTLGVELEIGEVVASWKGLTPRLDLHNVKVSDSGQQVFQFRRASAELSLLDSIASWRFAWRRIDFEQFEATLTQDEKGHWSVPGLATTGTNEAGFQVDDPLDIFLFGRRIDISDVRINLQFRTGHETRIDIPRVTLENDRDFHRLVARLEVDGQSESFYAVIEGEGDPRDKVNFQSRGFISLSHFPMEKVLAAVGADFWKSEDQQVWREGHRLNLSLWFSGNTARGLTLEGSLMADGLPLKLPESVSLPTSMQSHIHGEWHPLDGWQLALQSLQIGWQEQNAPRTNLKFYGRPGGDTGMVVRQFPVGEWLDTLRKMGLDQGKPGEVLSALRPRGTLHNLDIRFRGKEAGWFDLNAYLQDGAIDAFKGVPHLEQVDGFVTASALSGTINLDSRDGLLLDLPRVYHQPIQFERARGQLRWKVDPERRRTYISSGLLNVATDTEVGRGYLHLDLPFTREDGEPYMVLALGVDSGPALSHKRYVPKTVPDTLYQWLDRGIRGGRVSDVGFLFSGAVRKDPEVRPAIQLYANVHEGELEFDPRWPGLDQIDARLEVDNRDMTVQVQRAVMLDNSVDGATIDLIGEGGDDGRGLRIVGALHGDAAAAMRLLHQSPVSSAMGTAFDRWQVEGDVSAAISLEVPLTEEFGKGSQSVGVVFSGADIALSDLDLQLDNISGSLNYQSGRGLYSDQLTGELWGNPITARIEGQGENAADATRVHLSGEIAAADILRWSGRPELQFVTGQSEVSGVITIPPQSTGLAVGVTLQSDLRGTEIDLPPPLSKPAAEARSLAVSVDLTSSAQDYTMLYGDDVRLTLRRDKKGLQQGQLALGKDYPEPTPGYLDIVGGLQTFDLQQWSRARNQYFAYLEKAGRHRPETATEGLELPVRLNVTVEETLLGGLQLEDVRVTGLGTADQWRMHVDSELLRGQMIVGDGSQPLRLNLDYLHLPEPQGGDETARDERTSVLAGIDLSKAVPLDFVTRDFALGDTSFGSWQFELRPIDDGIVLENLRADIRGMELTGVPEEGESGDAEQPAQPRGARFVWRQRADGQTSEFSGQLRAGNIAEVLEAWGEEELFDSESVSLVLHTNWPGAPDQVTLHDLRGLVEVDMRQGNFIRGAEAGENPLLRLLALFNFDTIARRLQLDFSDLAKQGFAYDRVYGELEFSEGQLLLSDPLIVESTSSRVQWAGTIDMVEETLDTELVVTLPVTGNLAVATAFMWGLPAGVGVYLVGKLFKKQTDKLSSINYQVSGDWEDPKLKVRRIFDDTAAKLKGESVRQGADDGAP